MQVPVVWILEVPPVHEGWFKNIIENNYYAPGEFAITLDDTQTQKLARVLENSLMMGRSPCFQIQRPSTPTSGILLLFNYFDVSTLFCMQKTSGNTVL